MNNITFVTGPSATGKGTRIKRLYDHLLLTEQPYRPCGLLRNKNPMDHADKNHTVGIVFEKQKIVLVGKPTIREGVNSWNGLDGLFRWRITPYVNQWLDEDLHVMMDINMSLAGKGTCDTILTYNSDVDVIAFYYADKETAIARMDARAQRNNSKVGWDDARYTGSQSEKANERVKNIHTDRNWTRVPGTKTVVDATVGKDWLVNYYMENIL